MAELGQASVGNLGRLELVPPASLDELRDAEAVLHDPQVRLVHELFWFLPLNPYAPHEDPALSALYSGHFKTAASLWEQALRDESGDATTIAVAQHNMAVRWHLSALELETKTKGSCWTDERRTTVENAWKVGLAYWAKCTRSDALWNVMSARAIAYDDDRASIEYVQAMRGAVDSCILDINLGLLLSYTSANDKSAALAHIALIKGSHQFQRNPEPTKKRIRDQSKSELRALVDRARKTRDAHPESALIEAVALANSFSRWSAAISDLSVEMHAEWHGSVVDECVEQAYSCCVGYYNKTDNAGPVLEVMGNLLALKPSDGLAKKVSEGRKTIVGNRLFELVKAAHELMTEIFESEEPAPVLLERFVGKVLPIVSANLAALSEDREFRDSFLDRVSLCARSISVDAWNKLKDGKTAFAALDLADKFAASGEQKKKLAEDRHALIPLVAQQDAIKKKEKDKQIGWAVVAVLFILFIWYQSSTSGTTSGTYSAPATTPTSATRPSSPVRPPPYLGDFSSSGANGERTFRVPRTAVADLDRERAAANAAENAANAISARVRTMGNEIELRRAAGDSANEMIDDYNNLVHQANAKAAEAQRLIDKYNADLERVGH